MTIIFVCVEIPKFFTFNDINTYSGVKEKDSINNDCRNASNVNRPNVKVYNYTFVGVSNY